MSELILYQTEDGKAEVRLRAEEGTVWLSQSEMADLFATTIPNANIHIRNILKEGELVEEAVIKESLITAADGKRYETFDDKRRNAERLPLMPKICRHWNRLRSGRRAAPRK